MHFDDSVSGVQIFIELSTVVREQLKSTRDKVMIIGFARKGGVPMHTPTCKQIPRFARRPGEM